MLDKIKKWWRSDERNLHLITAGILIFLFAALFEAATCDGDFVRGAIWFTCLN
ncbi:hypothetical protein [Vibrio phage VpKK5]|uniref:hypothetical protein n=1 Tax=Vibrio phage VpKK5 TaxID=1538804 RepID=UPI0004F7AAC3|nr:hypothetical protein VC55_gp75 [Vibrio phage VpKK5]AIM40578.1 hypothetical protein [Vibrio phage VpKK5]